VLPSTLPAIVGYELSQALRARSFWAVALVSAFFGYQMAGAAGSVVSHGNVDITAPSSVATTVAMLSLLLGLYLASAVIAPVVTRDFEVNSWQIVFSYGVSRRRYVLGRFLGALAVATLAFGWIVPGFLFGAYGPLADAGEGRGPFDAVTYIAAFGWFGLANLFIVGSTLFMVATLTRRARNGYIAGVLVFALWSVSYASLNSEAAERWLWMFDSFGIYSLQLVTRYWTPHETNTLAVPLVGELLLNRVWWLGLSLLFLCVTVWRFRPAPPSERRPPERARHEGVRSPAVPRTAAFVPDRLDGLGRLLRRTVFEAGLVVLSTSFLILLALVVAVAITNALLVDPVAGSPQLALTRVLVQSALFPLKMMLTLAVTFYAAEVVWRERTRQIDQIIDATPVTSPVLMGAKLFALWLALLAMVACTAGALIIYQWFMGTPVDVGMYAAEFGFTVLPYLWVGVLALTLQVLAPNKYVGMLFMLLYIAVTLVGRAYVDLIAFVDYGAHPAVEISGIAGARHERLQALKYDAYWAAGSLALVLVSLRLWRRGTDEGLRRRTRALRSMSLPHATLLAASVTGFAGIGYALYLEDYAHNPRPPSRRMSIESQVRYEQVMRPLENQPLPAVAAMRLELDTDIPTLSAHSRGTLTLVNRHDQPLADLWVNLPPLATVRHLGVEGAAVLQEFPEIGTRHYRFAPALAPGEKRVLRFDLAVDFSHFPLDEYTGRLKPNGSFFNVIEVVPFVGGYLPSFALGEKDTRLARGLPPDRSTIATLEEPWGRSQDIFHGQGGGFIDFEGVYGVNAGQVGFMGGELVRRWDEGSRSYFHYRSEAPLARDFILQQGAYQIRTDRVGDIAVSIHYYDPYNIDAFQGSLKAAVEYFTEQFGSYPYKHFRLIQGGGGGAGAAASSGQLTFFEYAGFISDLSRATSTDWGTFVIGHEAGHNWWGVMVPAAKVEGAPVLSETMAQYSGVMLLEKRHGRGMVARFLRHSLKQYHRERTATKFPEVPLLRSRGQSDYIHYWKGAPVIYGVKELIGEESMNRALREFVRRWRFASGTYPTSRDLLATIRANTPPRYQETLTDWFERIVIHDLAVTDASAERLPDGRWRVRATVRARKRERTGDGAERFVTLHDPVQVVVVDEEIGRSDRYNATLLADERRFLDGERTQFEFLVNARPAAVIADPFHNYIERDVDDNVGRVKE
jgi:ABC-type transport system involved in multi-copper enzyme maturation permease subunit